MITIILLSITIFGLAMAIMGVGLIFSGRCLRGTCGGEGAIGPDGKPMACEDCPNKEEENAGPTQ